MQEKKTDSTQIKAEEEAEYKRQLEVFVRSSTEKGIELVKIGEIIAGLHQRESLLDNGAYPHHSLTPNTET
jgi:hypothetical protein